MNWWKRTKKKISKTYKKVDRAVGGRLPGGVKPSPKPSPSVPSKLSTPSPKPTSKPTSAPSSRTSPSRSTGGNTTPSFELTPTGESTGIVESKGTLGITEQEARRMTAEKAMADIKVYGSSSFKPMGEVKKGDTMAPSGITSIEQVTEQSKIISRADTQRKLDVGQEFLPASPVVGNILTERARQGIYEKESKVDLESISERDVAQAGYKDLLSEGEVRTTLEKVYEHDYAKIVKKDIESDFKPRELEKLNKMAEENFKNAEESYASYMGTLNKRVESGDITHKEAKKLAENKLKDMNSDLKNSTKRLEETYVNDLNKYLEEWQGNKGHNFTKNYEKLIRDAVRLKRISPHTLGRRAVEYAKGGFIFGAGIGGGMELFNVAKGGTAVGTVAKTGWSFGQKLGVGAMAFSSAVSLGSGLVTTQMDIKKGKLTKEEYWRESGVRAVEGATSFLGGVGGAMAGGLVVHGVVNLAKYGDVRGISSRQMKDLSNELKSRGPNAFKNKIVSSDIKDKYIIKDVTNKLNLQNVDKKTISIKKIRQVIDTTGFSKQNIITANRLNYQKEIIQVSVANGKQAYFVELSRGGTVGKILSSQVSGPSMDVGTGVSGGKGITGARVKYGLDVKAPYKQLSIAGQKEGVGWKTKVELFGGTGKIKYANDLRATVSKGVTKGIYSETYSKSGQLLDVQQGGLFGGGKMGEVSKLYSGGAKLTGKELQLFGKYTGIASEGTSGELTLKKVWTPSTKTISSSSLTQGGGKGQGSLLGMQQVDTLVTTQIVPPSPSPSLFSSVKTTTTPIVTTVKLPTKTIQETSLLSPSLGLSSRVSLTTKTVPREELKSAVKPVVASKTHQGLFSTPQQIPSRIQPPAQKQIPKQGISPISLVVPPVPVPSIPGQTTIIPPIGALPFLPFMGRVRVGGGKRGIGSVGKLVGKRTYSASLGSVLLGRKAKKVTRKEAKELSKRKYSGLEMRPMIEIVDEKGKKTKKKRRGLFE